MRPNELSWLADGAGSSCIHFGSNVLHVSFLLCDESTLCSYARCIKQNAIAQMNWPRVASIIEMMDSCICSGKNAHTLIWLLPSRPDMKNVYLLDNVLEPYIYKGGRTVPM